MVKNHAAAQESPALARFDDWLPHRSAAGACRLKRIGAAWRRMHGADPPVGKKRPPGWVQRLSWRIIYPAHPANSFPRPA